MAEGRVQGAECYHFSLQTSVFDIQPSCATRDALEGWMSNVECRSPKYQSFGPPDPDRRHSSGSRTTDNVTPCHTIG